MLVGPFGIVSDWPGSAWLSSAWPSSARFRSALLGPARPGSLRALAQPKPDLDWLALIEPGSATSARLSLVRPNFVLPSLWPDRSSHKIFQSFFLCHSGFRSPLVFGNFVLIGHSRMPQSKVPKRESASEGPRTGVGERKTQAKVTRQKIPSDRSQTEVPKFRCSSEDRKRPCSSQRPERNDQIESSQGKVP